MIPRRTGADALSSLTTARRAPRHGGRRWRRDWRGAAPAAVIWLLQPPLGSWRTRRWTGRMGPTSAGYRATPVARLARPRTAQPPRLSPDDLQRAWGSPYDAEIRAGLSCTSLDPPRLAYNAACLAAPTWCGLMQRRSYRSLVQADRRRGLQVCLAVALWQSDENTRPTHWPAIWSASASIDGLGSMQATGDENDAPSLPIPSPRWTRREFVRRRDIPRPNATISQFAEEPSARRCRKMISPKNRPAGRRHRTIRQCVARN